jgi:hypothetical protein
VRILPDYLEASFRVGSRLNGRVVDFSGNLYLCREGERGVCTIQTFRFSRKVIERKSAGGDEPILYSPPRPQNMGSGS